MLHAVPVPITDAVPPTCMVRCKKSRKRAGGLSERARVGSMNVLHNVDLEDESYKEP